MGEMENNEIENFFGSVREKSSILLSSYHDFPYKENKKKTESFDMYYKENFEFIKIKENEYLNQRIFRDLITCFIFSEDQYNKLKMDSGYLKKNELLWHIQNHLNDKDEISNIFRYFWNYKKMSADNFIDYIYKNNSLEICEIGYQMIPHLIEKNMNHIEYQTSPLNVYNSVKKDFIKQENEKLIYVNDFDYYYNRTTSDTIKGWFIMTLNRNACGYKLLKKNKDKLSVFDVYLNVNRTTGVVDSDNKNICIQKLTYTPQAALQNKNPYLFMRLLYETSYNAETVLQLMCPFNIFYNYNTEFIERDQLIVVTNVLECLLYFIFFEDNEKKVHKALWLECLIILCNKFLKGVLLYHFLGNKRLISRCTADEYDNWVSYLLENRKDEKRVINSIIIQKTPNQMQIDIHDNIFEIIGIMKSMITKLKTVDYEYDIVKNVNDLYNQEEKRESYIYTLFFSMLNNIEYDTKIYRFLKNEYQTKIYEINQNFWF